MFASLSNSWSLAKASARVLAADKELLVFPIVSFVLTLIVMATFAVPTFLAGILDAAVEEKGIPIAGYVVGFAFYVVQYFVIVFCQSALIGAALVRLRGGDPTVRDGFRIAFQHIGAIFGYALIAATVGTILRALSRRGTIGRFVSSLLGLAWNLATYLVVPVLVVENVDPIEAVKRSAGHLKRTWGEQIAGNIGLGAIFGLVAFSLIIPLVLLSILTIQAEAIALLISVIVVFVFIFVMLGLISSALGGIYTAAVYRYAAEGSSDSFFDAALVTKAFRAA